MNKVLILDFGSQYTQLIARRVRELHVYCEIYPCASSLDKIKSFAPDAVILSGGPASVYDREAPTADRGVLDLGVPVLGICYGLQWLARQEGGKVSPGAVREYGPAKVHLVKQDGIFSGMKESELDVWMSHGDHVSLLPPGYQIYGESLNRLLAACGNPKKRVFGIQFHPEVIHTPRGKEILKNFLFAVSDLKADWSMESFVEKTIRDVRETVGTGHVICAVSGGVDSSVMAALLHRALGDRLHPFFIDNGLLRKNEEDLVPELLKKNMSIPLVRVEAGEEFLQSLSGVIDPEEKRKRIGRQFITVFDREAAGLPGARFLAQGTLYPDVIESVSFRGPSAMIKSHHNVGGLPEKMNLKLLEPFRELFKDEVRAIGRLLGMPEEIIQRQPFPGPGLAVRILGDVTAERLKVLREADDIVVREFKRADLYAKVWQSFAVLLPVKTVGVMGDARTYENVIAVRVVESQDGMTADWVRLPYELLGKISSRIINEVRGVNRVVYDISSKPPATIEWE
ncbi:MAG: glutamine-hydrolyzing GMP synthase [Deltaproteobacteria bacterium]|nr:glutamine-hydrolyzing GMP synthase [Deltaproteobacteria bacterium]